MNEVQNAVTVKYVFPAEYKGHLNDPYIRILEKAMDAVRPSEVISNMRKVDYTITIRRELDNVVDAVAKEAFTSSYRKPTPFVTTDKAEVIETRRRLMTLIYKTQGFLSDLAVVLDTQAFLLKHTTAVVVNSQDQVLNSFGEQIDTPEMLQAQLAIDNLKELFRYYFSLQESSLYQTLVQNLDILDDMRAVISLGSKTYDPETDSVISWPDPVAF